MWFSAVVAVVVISALIWYAVSQRRVGKGAAPPMFPGALPLIGHGHMFGSGDSVALWDLMQRISAFALEQGGVAGFMPGPKQGYMVVDADDVVTVANASLEKDFIYDFMKPVLGEGLLTGYVGIWKIHRKLLTPAFSQVVLDGFLEVFNSQAKKLVGTLSQEVGRKPFDSFDYLGPNALETICLTAMGGAQADDGLRAKYMHAAESIYNIVIQRFQKFWLHSNLVFNWTSLGKEFLGHANIVHQVSDSVLQLKKRGLTRDTTIVSERTGSKFKAFIDLIIEYSGKDGLLTDREIRDEVNTIIVAGHDTSASTTVYTLLMLGSHPDVQERVFQEIQEVVGDGDVQKQHLPKLVYLEAVLKETLRLYPIAPFVVRSLTEDVKLKHCTLPAGSGVYLGYHALHRHAMWGADADQFVPERWLDKTRLPDHQAAFAAFSIGRRMCIGWSCQPAWGYSQMSSFEAIVKQCKSYALMGMKTNLAHLVRNFRYKSDVSKLKLKLDIMLKPHSGNHLSIERRT